MHIKTVLKTIFRYTLLATIISISAYSGYHYGKIETLTKCRAYVQYIIAVYESRLYALQYEKREWQAAQKSEYDNYHLPKKHLESLRKK